MPCDTRDHVIPVARDYCSRKASSKTQKNTIPACRTCNSLLGDKLFLTIGDRASYLYQVYKKRFYKILRMPSWNICEIDSLEGRMKRYVKSSIKKKESATSKIKHIELVIELCPTIEDVWEIINEENSKKSICLENQTKVGVNK